MGQHQHTVTDCDFDRDFGAICICAERYACGRETYMPDIVQRFIKAHIAEISNNDIDVMLQDLEGATFYGDERIDKPGWIKLLCFLRGELYNREAGHGNK